jgi:Polyketide cyclase / dehydrase and lipid transport
VATFRFHTRVPTAPDEVWRVLTDVDLIPDWFPGIDKASFDGVHRVLELATGGRLTAEVVTMDAELRRFQYRFVDGMPEPIEYHLGTLDVIEDPSGSIVVYSQEIRPDALGAVVGPAVGGGIEGIRRYFGG